VCDVGLHVYCLCAGKKGVFVEGLSEWVVRSPVEIFDLLQRGHEVRVVVAPDLLFK
jgi:hypothetical protein